MTSIASPSSLATFSSPHASSSKHPPVTLNAVKGRETGWAVAAAQGDGVWTYDLSTLRPVTTYTVPPSTSFNTAPVSFYPPSRHSTKAEGKQKADDHRAQEEGSGERISVVGVQRGEGVKKEQEGKAIWAWRGEDGVKSAIMLDYPIQSIHYLPHHRAPILCAHTDGHLTALDGNLHTRPVVLSPTVSGPIVASNATLTHGETVRVVLVNQKGHVYVMELDIGGPREISGRVVKSGLVGKPSVELDLATVAEDGTVIATASAAATLLLTRALRDLGQSTASSALSRGLSAAPLSLPIPGRPVSLFAVSEPEPTVLLVSSSAEAVAVLQALPLSSILPTTAAKITHLANVGASAPGTFTIALTVTQTEGGRTGIYTTEIAVPEKGVGMNLLLGTQRATAQYFGPEKHHRASTFDHLITGFAQTIPDGSAMSAFEAWLQVAEKSSPANVAFHLPESQAKAVISAVFNAALEKTEEGYRKTGVYASDIVQLLLRKKWINDEMYARGVVNALVQLEDWTSASLAIRSIRTIPSTSVISYVKRVCQSDDGMEVPSLDSVLVDILSSPVPPPDYRAALRTTLPVEDATKVLEVYTKWMTAYVNSQGQALAGWADDKGKKKKPDHLKHLPSLEALIAHASSLLDSHLPLFLSHPPSYDLLQTLQDSLGPLLALQESYRRLRAPVEAVLTLSRREAKKQAEREAKRNAGKPAGAGQGKNVKRDTEGQMPDEAVGKWRVEEFVF